MRGLAKRGCISAIFVDEVNADSYRPEFGDAVPEINVLLAITAAHNKGKRVPVTVMSATYTLSQQMNFNKRIGRLPSLVSWGEMDRRNVGIFVR